MHDGGFKSKLIAYLLYPIIFLMHKKAKRLAPEIDEIIADKKIQREAIGEYKKSLIFEYVTGKKRVTEVN